MQKIVLLEKNFTEYLKIWKNPAKSQEKQENMKKSRGKRKNRLNI